MRVLLASQSPARKATLEAAGITPLVRVSHIDEPAVLATLPGGRAFIGGSTTPGDEVLALATAKCQSIVAEVCAANPANFPTDSLLVVGCDSMVEVDGQMQGKPGTPETAKERIRAMRGRTVTLWTGHHVALLSATGSEGRRTVLGQVGQSQSTAVHFGDITDDEIDAYVTTGEPLHVAGAFTVDGLGGPFITGVTGDYHSVVGISLPLMRTLAQQLGVFWPDLWDVRQ